MNFRTDWATRSRWRPWSIMGLLISLIFLAHDVGMAAESGAAIATNVTSPAGVHVVHVIGARPEHEAGHPESPRQQCADDECPVESACGVDREAIPAANGEIDITLQAITADSGFSSAWQCFVEVRASDDAALVSAGDYRVLFQVFLI